MTSSWSFIRQRIYNFLYLTSGRYTKPATMWGSVFIFRSQKGGGVRDQKSLGNTALEHCFSNAGACPGTGTWHQLYRTVRDSPGICHFSFLRNFSWINILQWKYSEENNIRECVEKLRPWCWPEETTICYKISLVQWLITNLNAILYLSTCHTVHINILILFMIMP